VLVRVLTERQRRVHVGEPVPLPVPRNGASGLHVVRALASDGGG
jgi:hypothetical protein